LKLAGLSQPSSSVTSVSVGPSMSVARVKPAEIPVYCDLKCDLKFFASVPHNLSKAVD
jgi:hypothetical protein